MLLRQCALATLAACGPFPAAASGPVGIAYVAAPERASGICTAPNPDRAFACARERCAAQGRAQGVKPGECLRLAWCYPAGWSVVVSAQHRDGFHAPRFTCGLDSREQALKLAALQCDRAAHPYLLECAAVELHGPDGRVHKP